MNRYLSATEAALFTEEHTSDFIDDPYELPITEPFADAGVVALTGKPVELYRSQHPVLRHLGSRAMSILDLAAGDSPIGLYLAAQGHDVTVGDRDEASVQWQKKAAADMGLDTFHASRIEAAHLRGVGRYDIIMATMLLHFLTKAETRHTLRNMQDATEHGGLNIITVYTADNPDEERTKRGLVTMHDPADVEQAYVRPDQMWLPVERRVGLRRATTRPNIGNNIVLIPTVAEVTVRRVGNRPQNKYLPDFHGDVY